jgi:hypothetical protein
MSILFTIILYNTFYILYIGGFIYKLKNIVTTKKFKSNINDFQYDWTSGEVAWEYDNYDIEDETYNTINYKITNLVEREIIETNSGNTNIILQNELNSNLENIITIKAIVSGIMKGIYMQIMTIDNVIAYTQCYTNKVVKIDVLLTIIYFIIYEKNKIIEKNDMILLKDYSNIYLLEKYIKLRRNSSIIVVIIYILFFRGISNAE